MNTAKLAKPRQQPDPLALGRRLKDARKQFGWTLVNLAERSGVSITTISRAERGQLALGYENFAALAAALQMDVGELFSESSPHLAKPVTGPVVTRAGEGVHYHGHAITYEFLASEATHKPINPTFGIVHARKINGPEDYAKHAGVEFTYVLSGAIEVHFEDGSHVRLNRGDSLYFESRIGHAYISVSKSPAQVVGVITAESNHIADAKPVKTTAASADRSVDTVDQGKLIAAKKSANGRRIKE